MQQPLTRAHPLRQALLGRHAALPTAITGLTSLDAVQSGTTSP